MWVNWLCVFHMHQCLCAYVYECKMLALYLHRALYACQMCILAYCVLTLISCMLIPVYYVVDVV